MMLGDAQMMLASPNDVLRATHGGRTVQDAGRLGYKHRARQKPGKMKVTRCVGSDPDGRVSVSLRLNDVAFGK